MTLRQRKYSQSKDPIIQTAVELLRKNVGFFKRLNYGNAELEGKPDFSWDKTKKDFVIEFPMVYMTKKKVDDDWTEGPEAEGTFAVYVYPSSDSVLEFEMGYEDEDGHEMKSDRGKKVAQSSLRVSGKNLDWNMIQRELKRLHTELGGVEAQWVD